jgi:chorismate synthase
MIRNTSHHSADYDDLRGLYRPGHADWTWEAKYGRRDHRGGGRSSGRETLGRVAAGAVARAFLASRGISLRAWTSSIAGIDIPGPEEPGFDPGAIDEDPFRLPRRDYTEKVRERIEALKKEGDSAGGIAGCMVRGLTPGLGEPVFGKLEARIAEAMLSIGAAKGVEFGAGFAAAGLRGSDNNDRPLPAAPGNNTAGGDLPPGVPDLNFASNRAGGVLGGLSTGAPLEFRVAFKPVPSISKQQLTVDRGGAVRELAVRGRHDICIVPRAVPVVEAMAALVIADLLLLHRSARI